MMTAGLFAQDAEPVPDEYRQPRRVGRQVAVVLARARVGQSPVLEADEGGGDGVGRFGEHVEQIHPAIVAGWSRMAVIDVAGFVADLKDHAADHGFHVHDERHFVETYSLRQAWEVDLHPEEACNGPLDLHLSLEVDPRQLLSFEDVVLALPDEDEDPDDNWHFPLLFTWTLPPLPSGPDLLVLATELAGVGGTDLPLEVSAIDSFASVTDAAERSLSIVARIEVSLAKIFRSEEQLCDVLDHCLAVSEFLVEHAPGWLAEP